MRIQFVRAGGIAAPAQSREAIIDTAQLPPQQASELESLVEASGIFTMPEARGGVDAERDPFVYGLTVEAGERKRSIEIPQSRVPGNLRPLVDWLMRQAHPPTPHP